MGSPGGRGWHLPAMPAAAPPTCRLSVEIAGAFALALLLAACGRWPELARGALPQGVAGQPGRRGRSSGAACRPMPSPWGWPWWAWTGWRCSWPMGWPVARGRIGVARRGWRGCWVCWRWGWRAWILDLRRPGCSRSTPWRGPCWRALVVGPMRGLAPALAALAGLFSLGGGLLVGLCMRLLCGLAARLGPGRPRWAAWWLPWSSHRAPPSRSLASPSSWRVGSCRCLRVCWPLRPSFPATSPGPRCWSRAWLACPWRRALAGGRSDPSRCCRRWWAPLFWLFRGIFAGVRSLPCPGGRRAPWPP